MSYINTNNNEYRTSNNPVTGFNFVMEVEQKYLLALKSVKAFNMENEYEYIQEGGVNDFVHMRKKPVSKPATIQVERYIGTDRFFDPLIIGKELNYPINLYLYRNEGRRGTVENENESPARIYIFTGCVVTGKDYGELNAEQSSLVTESITIAFRELSVVNNPSTPDEERQKIR
ncbi:MAG: hypothetical protein J5802_07950 [Butyrivibrio sp.]|nr:hypothetical protein [Butyrivibrio sp.]